MHDIQSVKVSLINSRIEKQFLRGSEESGRYCFVKEGIGIFLVSTCWGVRGHRVGGHADRAYMLLGMCKPDFVVARLFRLPLCLFYLPPRRASTRGLIAKRKREREKEKEGQRCDVRTRGRNASFARFVVLENRILIAWMPSKILVDRTTPAAKESERRCMVIDPNMRRTLKSVLV